MKSLLDLCMIIVAITTTGCASFVDEDCRHITSVLNEKLTPVSTFGKVATAPIAVPVGLTSVLFESAIITPIDNTASAYNFVYDMVSYEYTESTGVFEVVVFPMRIVTFTTFFLGAELGSTCFGYTEETNGADL